MHLQASSSASRTRLVGVENVLPLSVIETSDRKRRSASRKCAACVRDKVIVWVSAQSQGQFMTKDRPYRRGVGIMLLNVDRQVWVGRRIDNSDEAWQMPQGGMDEGETPWATALRELEEETGIPPHLVERIADCPERLRYDLPPELQTKLWGGKWRGQEQDWFLCRFLGRTSDIDIATKHPEFNAWKWVEPAELPNLIVPFKRDLYRDLLRHFDMHI